MKMLCLLVLFVVGSLNNQGGWQAKEKRYYRKEIGMSFVVEYGSKPEKVPYGVGWDFLFSIKNDSTAIIQDIKRGVYLPPKEYKVSRTFDSSYVRRSLNGGKYKIEKSFYHTIYPLN